MAARQGARDAQMRCGMDSLISLILPLFKAKTLANGLRGLAQQKMASSLLHRRSGRAPRVKLRRRKPALLTALGSIPPDVRCQVQDSGGWQDDDAEKDV